MARLELPLPDPEDEPPAVVVPVPTTRRRERARGYNQARLLAAEYARLRGLRLVDGLTRREGGGTQVSLHPEERRANVEAAFALRKGGEARLDGRRVILVDDVLTTGATAGAAARVLERAGARGVLVVSFARALPGRSPSTTGSAGGPSPLQ
jgi:ComF family protein